MGIAEITIIKRMEEKLIELMGAEAYEEFAKETAREAFLEEVKEMPESDFKAVTMNNIERITKQ